MYKAQLKNVRESFELTERAVAKILNISNSLYCDYENEKQILPIKHLNVLCKYFNVSLDYLFNFTNVKNYSDSTEVDINKSMLRLKEFRKENKLTQTKLASILKVANGTIANYEVGRNIIATPFLYDVCKRYKISADYLLGRTDTPKYLD